MSPEFADRKKERLGLSGSPTITMCLRVELTIHDQLADIALAEGDNLSDIVFEGVLRVIQDRDSGPEFGNRLTAAREQQILDLESKIASLRKPTAE